jgi:hypothetical protein
MSFGQKIINQEQAQGVKVKGAERYDEFSGTG